MKHQLCAAALFVSSLAFSLQAATPYTHQRFLDDPEEFHFAIIPDRTGGDLRGAWTNALAKVNLLRPAFVMTVGDLIPAGWLDEASVVAQQEELRQQLASVVPPFYSVVGNHDIQTPVSKRVWQRYFGENTYYSFRYKDVLFMALDTQDAGISAAQYAWAKETLAAHADVRWTFIFMHAPDTWLKPAWQAFEREALAGRRYNVFAGDLHTYFHARRNGNDYYALSVAGGGSAMNGQDPSQNMNLTGPDCGEMDHLTWVTVPKSGRPVIANIRLDGIFAGDYLDQSNSKTTYVTKAYDDPVDPAVQRHLDVLEARRRALFYRWDAKTFDRWTAPGGGRPSSAWRIDGGELRAEASDGPATLELATDYENADWHFKYRLEPGATAKLVYSEEGCVDRPVVYEMVNRPERWTFGRVAVTGKLVTFEIDGQKSDAFVRANARPSGRFRLVVEKGKAAFSGIYVFDLRDEPPTTAAKLVSGGVAQCRVVVPAKPTPSEAFAKAEIEKYLSVATGCGELAGVYPIELVTDASLAPETFVLDVTRTGLKISGGDARGVLYGAYELLKKHAGMRWVTPGEDGEYCVHAGGDLVVPFGRTEGKPAQKIRTMIGDEPNYALWSVRNNLQMALSVPRFRQNAALYSSLGVVPRQSDGHILSALLLSGGKPGQSRKERAQELFALHPEWFPLIGGKRVVTDGATTPNPCVSNPELLDHMAEALLANLSEIDGDMGYHTIGNNDTTVWCQCEKCCALDAPEAKNTRGERSDRYWYMVNEIARRVWAKRPDAKLGGWAYQNFWYPPRHVKPDPRLRILISFNNQCWRHACDDKACPVNVEMVRIYTAWKELGHPLVVNRDEIGAWDGNGSPGCELLPSERVLAANMRAYAAIGCHGSQFCVNSPFPEYSSFAKTWAPFYGKRYHWYAMWQTCYMSARAMWDPAAEFDRTLEEANRLYYGAGWDGGMREFRALLADCFFATPGCIGWGQGATTGRCLDKAGSEERLTALLAQAVAAAEAAGDERALRHVRREQEIFGLTWVKARKTYVESYREMTAYRRTGEITVDGVLDETDWQTADVYSNFALPTWLRQKLTSFQKTRLRIVYDRDTLYFGVEAMEPTPEKIIAGEQVDRSCTATGNLGNHLELFYSYPDMNQAAWHLMINSNGQIVDALQKSATDRDATFVTTAKWAVKTLPDRWTLEVAIPCSEIGQNILDGMTWKINCARVREVRDAPRELSTAANGQFHGTAGFMNVKFAPRRTGAAE